MGKTATTRKDYSNWTLTERVTQALMEIGLEANVAALDTLQVALRGFELNRTLWPMIAAFDWPCDRTDAATLLQSHLAFTLFVPAGRASQARKAVDALRVAECLPFTNEPDIATFRACIDPYVRFPQQKLDRLMACVRLWPSIVELGARIVHTDMPAWAAQKEVMQLPGYGPKAAAHFMRNTGLATGLPIIDVHIHKALAAFKMDSDKYEEADAAFVRLSDMFEVPVFLLDAALWCAYSGNWNMHGADFDNFGYAHDSRI